METFPIEIITEDGSKRKYVTRGKKYKIVYAPLSEEAESKIQTRTIEGMVKGLSLNLMYLEIKSADKCTALIPIRKIKEIEEL